MVKGGKLLVLTIESTVGTITRQYNENQPIKAVKKSAMAELHIDPATADKYGLFLDNQRLPEDKTLKEAGVPNKATLLLSLLSAVVI